MNIELPVRDLLFINYAVDPEIVRQLVPEHLTLDTITGGSGAPVAFLSAVPFRVVDLRANFFLIPSLSFNQINYRTYVTSDEGPAVYFFEMKVSSRLVSTAAGFLGLPVSHEEIEIAVTSPSGEAVVDGLTGQGRHYAIRSEDDSGLQAQLIIDGRHERVGPEAVAIAPEFITERPVGFVSAAGGIFKIEVSHLQMNAVSARIESVAAPRLQALGLLNTDQIKQPHSALYVPEIVFNTTPPGPWVP